MRKLIVLALTFSLGGCMLPTMESIKTAIHFGTASIANPVTPTRLNQMENGVKVVFAGLNTWKRLCVDGAIPDTCKDQIRGVQVYTRQIPPYLADLRRFVKTNDQVNATMVFNSLTDTIGKIKSQAAASGHPVSAGET